MALRPGLTTGLPFSRDPEMEPEHVSIETRISHAKRKHTSRSHGKPAPELSFHGRLDKKGCDSAHIETPGHT